MKKKVLSEVDLFYGDVSMPKGFEINKDVLVIDTFVSKHLNRPFDFSIIWDMLNRYVIDHIGAIYNISLSNKDHWGDMYTPLQNSEPLLQIDKLDLKDSPDYVLLYGVNVTNCSVRIYYEDNRRKGRSWDMPLENNKFIMFPSTCEYFIFNKHTDFLNTIHTITYYKI
tara:strand:- start:10 stop:513 length:504 start_codon:yes stop_codon:yes gene_type:complete